MGIFTKDIPSFLVIEKYKIMIRKSLPLTSFGQTYILRIHFRNRPTKTSASNNLLQAIVAILHTKAVEFAS